MIGVAASCEIVEHVSGVLVRSGCQALCSGIELASRVPFHRGQRSAKLLWRGAVPVSNTSYGKLFIDYSLLLVTFYVARWATKLHLFPASF